MHLCPVRSHTLATTMSSAGPVVKVDDLSEEETGEIDVLREVRVEVHTRASGMCWLA
jgi:hypothetical protein